MANTLQDAITAIQSVVDTNVTSIRKAPAYAPESINVFPFSVCYAGSGSWQTGPVGTRRGLHNIILEIHTNRADLPRDLAEVVPLGDSVANALLADTTFGNAVATFDRLAYTFGALGYAGQDTIGFRFTLENVKVLNST